MGSDSLGKQLKQTRERLRLTQSTVAAYVTVRLRTDYNQGRVSDGENGLRSLSPEEAEIMSTLYRKVEELREQNRHWSDVFYQ
jgi:transcriptional regulator with XRE-family HTH domain